MKGKCDRDPAVVDEKREEEEIRKAMEESLKEKGGKEKRDKKMSISEGGRDDGREEGGAGVAVGADGADGAVATLGPAHDAQPASSF